MTKNPYPSQFFLLLLLLHLLGGCVTQEDIAAKFDFYDETRSVLIAHIPEFINPSIPLDKIPPGKAHWITHPSKVKELLSSMSFETLTGDADKVHRTFVLAFLPEDPHSRTIFFLDNNLNLMGGFTHHGTSYGSSYYRTSDMFKKIILRHIEGCPQCRAYFPALNRNEDSEETPAQ